MDTPRKAPDGPCIVVHRNLLVAEDLKDVLISAGASDVLSFAVLEDAEGYAAQLAIVEAAGYEDVYMHPSVTHWIAMGTPVVVLNGHTGEPDPSMGLYSLEQPFRSEDLNKILLKLSVF